MEHYLLTRAVYSPGRWPIDANRRRLRLFRGITVASLAAQTSRDWRWLIAVDPEDDLLEQRQEAAREAGVPVRFLPVVTPAEEPRSRAAVLAYQATWADRMNTAQPRLTTRLDDDDAFSPDAMSRVRGAAREDWEERVSLQLPEGFRVWRGRFTSVRHETNAMATLYSPPGDPSVVYTFMHREITNHARRIILDDRPGWLWVRHPDTLSGWKRAMRPISQRLRARFPIDWELLEVSEMDDPVPGGDLFR